MIRWHWLALSTGLLLFCGAGLASQQKSKPLPALPGITSKDPFPNGCVSCHIILPDGKDMRLNVAMKALKKHPSIAKLQSVPADCKKCHAKGSVRGGEKIIHKMHFGKKEKSIFIQEFGGQCLNCHSLDTETGKMAVKTGPRNW